MLLSFNSGKGEMGKCQKKESGKEKEIFDMS